MIKICPFDTFIVFLRCKVKSFFAIDKIFKSFFVIFFTKNV